jgi:hypothetical protein
MGEVGFVNLRLFLLLIFSSTSVTVWLCYSFSGVPAPSKPIHINFRGNYFIWFLELHMESSCRLKSTNGQLISPIEMSTNHSRVRRLTSVPDV